MKNGPSCVQGQPVQRVRHDLAATAFNGVVAIFIRRGGGGTRHRRCRIRAQNRARSAFRDRERAIRQRPPCDIRCREKCRERKADRRPAAPKIIDLVKLRIRSRENRRVRGRRQRHLRVGMGEHHRLECQGVEMRRESALRAQKSHAIGARRIERNQDVDALEAGAAQRHGQIAASGKKHKQTAIQKHGIGRFIMSSVESLRPSTRGLDERSRKPDKYVY
jgi:hypothetical protein